MKKEQKANLATLEHVRMMFEAGAIKGATIKAVGSRFCILLDTTAGGKLCVTRWKDYTPRMFANINTATRTLFDIGLRTMVLDFENWTPQATQLKGI